MFGLTVTVAPTEEPLSLTEVQANIGETDSSRDDELGALIVAARQYCEVQTGRAFVTRTLRLSLDRFPSVIRLPFPPLIAVSAITYVDTAEATQTLATSEYQVDATTEPGRIIAVDTWPTIDDRMAAVLVTYTAGYGAASAVPQGIKQAMHLLVAHWYRNKEAVGNVGGPVEMATKALLGAYWCGSMAGTY